MIAIPNMGMPKSCYNHCLEGFIANEEIGCPLKNYTESHQYKTKIHPDCPLIDIVTCKECIHKIQALSTGKGATGCELISGTFYEDFFCKCGERRADGDI